MCEAAALPGGSHKQVPDPELLLPLGVPESELLCWNVVQNKERRGT